MTTNPAKPIDFRFGDYINEGYNLYIQNFGKVLLASFFLIVMSIIPFCSYLAQGNFHKFLKRLKEGKNPDASEIFNFDDFLPYFKLFLIVLGAVLLLEIPIIVMAYGAEQNGDAMPAFFPFFMLIFVALLFYFFAKAFYMSGLISLRGVKSIREAWRISNRMSAGNFWLIIAFVIVITFLSQIGFIALIIGVFITLPFYYTSYFAAVDDGLNQALGQESGHHIRKF